MQGDMELAKYFHKKWYYKVGWPSNLLSGKGPATQLGAPVKARQHEAEEAAGPNAPQRFNISIGRTEGLLFGSLTRKT